MTATQTFVDVRIEAGVAVVTVDNPPVNALGRGTIEGLDAAARRVEEEDVRCVVLTGAGEKAFMAGADIAEFEQLLAEPDGIATHSAWTRSVLDRWDRLAPPTIAAVQATAMGGGLEIALLCDLIVADERARFGLPEVKLGLIPGGGGTQRLPRRVGTGHAKRMLMLGSAIDAARAEAIGLVDVVAPAGGALDAARELATRLAALPAVAVQAAKEAADGALTGELVEGLDRERALFLRTFGSEDFREGYRAFLDKRAPQFSHR